MNSRIFKAIAAALLAVGITSASVSAPASAAILKKTTTVSTADTGWGRL
jgi:ABC-type tungstate transport system permease subunit